jgi:CRISPR/Cas system CSM-associated protein Csm4 (group 5 of RAMP superfamily)
MESWLNSTKHLKEVILSLLKPFQENQRGRNTSKFLLKAKITLLPKPGKNIIRTENYRPIDP